MVKRREKGDGKKEIDRGRKKNSINGWRGNGQVRQKGLG